jgi:hypothetical protein
MTTSHDVNMVGVMTGKVSLSSFALRVRLRELHMQQLGHAERLMVRGNGRNGLIVAPSENGNKPYHPPNQPDTYYLQRAVSFFDDLTEMMRPMIWVQSHYENGHLLIPPLPPEWIKGGTHAPPHQRSLTVPPAKIRPPYEVPDDADIRELQGTLGEKLDEARAIIRFMESRTGLRLVLDRNLRVVVQLPG